MGGKGAQPQNSQMVQFEKEQAAKAERKEAERKARLESGMAQIDEIFRGKPIMGKKAAKLDLTGITGPGPAVDASGAASAGLPTPSNFKRQWAPEGYSGGDAPQQIGDTGWQIYSGTEKGGGPAYLAYDSTGALRGVGASFEQATQGLQGTEYMKEYSTGEYDPATDPFGAKFKDPYKKSLTGLHMENLNKTYNDALEEAMFAHSRAGTRGSTAFTDSLTDIGGSKYEDFKDPTTGKVERRETPYGQYGAGRAAVTSDVDAAMGKLSDQISSAQDAAEAQLYMTEDPEKAANAARVAANQIPAVPQYNTLGDMFKPLVIGATGFYQGYQGQNDFNRAFNPKSSLDPGSGKITR